MTFHTDTVDSLNAGDVFAYETNGSFEDEDFDGNADWIRFESFEADDDGEGDTIIATLTYLHQNHRADVRIDLRDTVAVHHRPQDFEDNE